MEKESIKYESVDKELGNYRPIALLECDQKIFTHIIYQKLLKHMDNTKKLEPSQFGFRKDIDIAQALLCYLDFFKAYDSVEIDMLIRTLKYYKVPEKIIDLVENLYQNNKAIFKTNFGATEETPIGRGVKQGDVLSPLLFIIFINPLQNSLRDPIIMIGKKECKGQKSDTTHRVQALALG